MGDGPNASSTPPPGGRPGMLRRAATQGNLMVGNATSATQAALERRRNLGIHQEKKVKRQAKPVEMPDIDWMPLFEEAGGDDAKGEKPLTWEEIQQMNKKRRSLLALARETSPINTVLRISVFPRTVLPRLLKHPLMWIVMGVYVATAAFARLGLGGDVGDAEDVLNGGGTFVAFTIIFYVGYCYNRYNQQFDDVQCIMHSIVNATLCARATFKDRDETHRLWRYLNAMHASAYCGLTDYLTEDNFFLPLCDKHKLLGDGAVRQEELAALREIGLDENGSRACSMYEVWCFEVIRKEAIRVGGADFSAPIHARLQAEVNDIGDHIKRLFAYRFQVLPFIYTHLVSMCSFLYTVFTAFSKGLYFTPDAGPMAAILPACGVMMTSLTVFGLLEVGNTILDPFGSDPEDFALLHFTEYALCSSFEASKMKVCGPRLADRTDCYTDTELEAAKVLLRSMIKRHRWLKIIERARAHGAAQRHEAAKDGPGGGGLSGGGLASASKGQQLSGSSNVVMLKGGADPARADTELTRLVRSTTRGEVKLVDGHANGAMRTKSKPTRSRSNSMQKRRPAAVVAARATQPSPASFHTASTSSRPPSPEPRIVGFVAEPPGDFSDEEIERLGLPPAFVSSASSNGHLAA